MRQAPGKEKTLLPHGIAALGSTEHHSAFDAAVLNLKERGKALCGTDPVEAQHLIEKMFRAAINPLGEDVLAGLIVSGH